MTAIGISITATCKQCHVNFPINALTNEAHCPDCNQALAISWAVWGDVLSAAAIDGPNVAPNEDHVDAVVGGAGTKLIRNYVRRDATCAKCKAPLPFPRALQGADHGFCICVQCGEKVALRHAPNELKQLGGITHVIGEEQVPSGRSRLFYLWHERSAHAAAAPGNELGWESLKDVACDRNGNVYILAELDDELRLWAFDPSFKLRWQRQGLTTGRDQLSEPKMCLTANGYMIVRAERRHSALVISCADGSTALTLGGPEPANATAHGFDLKDCATLTCDVDGTILGAIHKRLLRWTYDGQPVETWPVSGGLFSRHHKPQPLYRMGEREERIAIEASAEYPPDPKEIGNQPYELDADEYDEIHVGFDGNLIYREGHDLAKIDRQGNIIMRVGLPAEYSHQGRVQSDGYGNTYLLTHDSDARKILRISPDGKRVDVAVDGERPGTPIWDGDELAVLPNGTIFVFDSYGSARCFNPDGSLRFISPKARERDQEQANEREMEAR